MIAELNSYKTGLVNIDVQIAERKASMDKTKQRYATEKARFIVLKTSDTITVNKTVAPDNLQANPTSAVITKVK